MQANIMFDDGRIVALPESIKVNIRGKEHEAKLADYPDVSLVRILVYGLTQILNDGHALPEGASAEAHFGAAMKRNDKLLKGELSVRLGGGRTTDAIALEAMAMAVNDVKAEWRGKKKLGAEAVAKEAKERIKKYAMYTTIAAENIERRKAMAAQMSEEEADELVADVAAPTDEVPVEVPAEA